MAAAIQASVDTRALELAADVNSKIQTHTVECRDRYLAIDAKMDKIDKKLDDQDDHLDWGLRTTDCRKACNGLGGLIVEDSKVLLLQAGDRWPGSR